MRWVKVADGGGSREVLLPDDDALCCNKWCFAASSD